MQTTRRLAGFLLTLGVFVGAVAIFAPAHLVGAVVIVVILLSGGVASMLWNVLLRR